jgi:hypothetical protein
MLTTETKNPHTIYYPHLHVEIKEEEIPVEYVETRFSLREGK